MNFAIIESGGKQYRVEEGIRINVELLPQATGAEIQLDRVLAIFGKGDSEPRFGEPIISSVSIPAKIIEHGRDDKLLIFKKRRRKNSRRMNGHRQHYTCIEIGKIPDIESIGRAGKGSVKEAAR